MTLMATPMVSDELDALVSALCLKFPEFSPREVEAVVVGAYTELAADARVTAHLIPLTLNRSRRLLADRTAGVATGPRGSSPHDREGLLATTIRTNAS